MNSKSKESIGIFLDASQTSIDRTCVVTYTKSVITSPEIEVSPSDVNISTDGIIPKDLSKESLTRPPKIKTESDPMYKVTTALFGVLWILSMIALAVGVVLYYEQVSVLRTEMDSLRSNITYLTGLQETKVAFAASLRRQTQVTLGPYKEFRILIYENIFSNFGNAYNRATGIFTAPVKGVYQFSFTAFGWSNGIPTAADLYKNGEYVTGVYDNDPGPGRGTALSVALELAKGDLVYLGLAKGMRVHDNTNHYNVFSGHLLFSLSDNNF